MAVVVPLLLLLGLATGLGSATVARGVLEPVRSFKLISFDLDDTLWPTGPVVLAANSALAQAVGGCPDDLQKRLREARSKTTPPPSYSEARILAVESWMCESAGFSPGSCRTEAEQMFDLWLSERHAAASRLLFDGAATAIAEARRLHPDAAVAAITNGRGDPLAMPDLAALFDFTISAESASIYPNRKPAREPFLAALRLAGCEARPSEWAHVGDDLINDVQASRALGAWAIWLAPPPKQSGAAPDAAAAAASSPDDAVGDSFWFSTMSDEERQARRVQAEGALGAASATIHAISELPTALEFASMSRYSDAKYRSAAG